MKLKPTGQGKCVVGTTTAGRLTGVMEIKNTAGTAISSTRITIKLKNDRDGRTAPRRIDRDAARVLEEWAPCLTAHLLAFMFRP